MTPMSPGPWKTQAFMWLEAWRARPWGCGCEAPACSAAALRRGLGAWRGGLAACAGAFAARRRASQQRCAGGVRDGAGLGQVEALEQAGLAAGGGVLVDDALLRGLVERAHRRLDGFLGGVSAVVEGVEGAWSAAYGCGS